MAIAIRFLSFILVFHFVHLAMAGAQLAQEWPRGLKVYDSSSNRAGVIGSATSADGQLVVSFDDPVKRTGGSRSLPASSLLKEAPSLKVDACGEEFEVKKGAVFVGKERGLYEVQAVFPNGKMEVLRLDTARFSKGRTPVPQPGDDSPERIDYGIVDKGFVREMEQQCNQFCPDQSVGFLGDGRAQPVNYAGARNGNPIEYKVQRTFCGGSITLKNPNHMNAPPALLSEQSLYAFHPGLSPTAVGRAKKNTEGTP